MTDEDKDVRMSRTVLLVGTRKGLWIGTSDEAREEWAFTGPHHNICLLYTSPSPRDS